MAYLRKNDAYASLRVTACRRVAIHGLLRSLALPRKDGYHSYMSIQHTLGWKDNTPFSAEFDDIYFHPTQGLAESRYVFLDGNKLAQRFKDAAHFTIAELGFGTGLNLLASWELIRATAPEHARLHYIAFEAYPLPHEALLQAVSHWPEMATLAHELFAKLGVLDAGIHRIHAQQLSLTLVIGDARQWLPQLSLKADAWFLDGFAPAKNPQMWENEVLHHVARCTAPAGTLATFSAAGHVRQGLAGAGFDVQKIKGFGNKRHMITATKSSESIAKKTPQTIAIIGAGLAGCSTAHALAERGLQVTLYESREIANGASGNPAGALYPPLHKQWSPAMQFYWDALAYMYRQLPLWKLQGLGFDFECRGMLKLPTQENQMALWPSLPETLGLPSHRLEWHENRGALFIPQSCWVDVRGLCVALSSHPNITLKTSHPCDRLPQGFDAVILANASAAKTFFSALPLHWNRGQLSYLAPDTQPIPKPVISHKGYGIFTHDKTVIGATYDRHNESTQLREKDHIENIETSCHYAPLIFSPDAKIIGGRASLRSVTPDRMPIIGQIESGIFISAGHGSRGLLSAPFGAEILADLIFDTPCPATISSLKLLSPERFM